MEAASDGDVMRFGDVRSRCGVVRWRLAVAELVLLPLDASSSRDRRVGRFGVDRDW